MTSRNPIPPPRIDSPRAAVIITVLALAIAAGILLLGGRQ